MSDEAIENPKPDVAMFIDWENMHGYIRGKANISALREVAESYGRLVLAKAYADWRETRFQQDSLLLYKIGFEPVYVPAGFKNNVDVKLATDCIDFSYRYPNIQVFILVTGDGDFIHVVSALRPLGKSVVVIAQSNNASSRLGDLVDTLLIYEQDVNPSQTNKSPKNRRRRKEAKSIDDVYQNIIEMIQKGQGAPILLTNVKQKLIRDYGKFNQQEYGFEKFKEMIENGAQQGHFVLNTAGLRDWLTLPHNDTRPNSNTELPDEIDQVYQEIARVIKDANQEQVYLSVIKDVLTEKYGGFDESVYGYNQFKEMMEEGERLDYFRLGVNRQSHYAFPVATTVSSV